MGLRVLSGVLVPDPGKGTAGQAEIDFDTHQVKGDASGQNLNEWGEPGTYDSTPSAVVSLKRLRIADRNFFLPPPGIVDIELFNVRESTISKTSMEVEWTATNGARIDAISYMVIGEA